MIRCTKILKAGNALLCTVLCSFVMNSIAWSTEKSGTTNVPFEVELIDLEYPGAVQTSPVAINNSGTIAGYFVPPMSGPRSFLWREGMGFSEIAQPSPFDTSEAADINDLGIVVGVFTIEGPNPQPTPYAWWGGTTLNLGSTLYPMVSVIGINNRGDIAGIQRAIHPDPRAGFWSRGRFFDIGTFGGLISYAHDINNLSEVVGVAQDSSGKQHPFLWRNGQKYDLGFLPGTDGCVAMGVNDHSVVVGYCTAGSEIVGFRSEHGIMRPLPRACGSQSWPKKINNEGIIVGVCSDPGYNYRSAVWMPDGNGFDLNTLLPPDSGWNLEDLININDRNEAIGRGTYNGIGRAFLVRSR